jgi:hypothetical protein
VKVPYADALNVALTMGVLPEPGGFLDQEAPFADALAIVSASLSATIRRGMEHAG